jgi:hypothetical protein
MTRRALTALATAVGLGVAASTAGAHHSYGTFFDLCASVTLEGRIEGVEWKNPHSYVDVRLDDGTAFRAEWTSLKALTRLGVAAGAEAALTLGERVVITGSPAKDPAAVRAAYPAFRGWTQSVVSALTEIHRSTGGWSWRTSEPLPRASCAARQQF